MLRKILIFALISSPAALSSIAIADTSTSGKVNSGLYLTSGVGNGFENNIDGNIGGTDITATGRITFFNEIGIGYYLGNSWRVESGMRLATSDVDNVTVDETEYDIDVNGAGVGVKFSVAYDLENDTKITPYLGVSNTITWSDDVYGISTLYGVAFGISTPLFDFLDCWGAIDLSISPYQTNKQVSYDGATTWGFSTGIRVKL